MVIPPSAEAILEHLGAVAREQVIVDGRTFLLDRPAESDRLAKHPAVRAAFEADQYVPYWADLWPAARMLAKAILREPWTPGSEALEVAASRPAASSRSMGLSVTFSDYDPCKRCALPPTTRGSMVIAIFARCRSTGARRPSCACQRFSRQICCTTSASLRRSSVFSGASWRRAVCACSRIRTVFRRIISPIFCTRKAGRSRRS